GEGANAANRREPRQTRSFVMTPVRTLALAALTALTALTGFATARPAGAEPPAPRPTAAYLFEGLHASAYSLTEGTWVGQEVDGKGRSIMLGFRNDGQCIMVVFDAATKQK